MTQAFSIKESLQFGWEKTKTHSTVLFQVVITLFALEVAYAVVHKVLEHTLLGIFAGIAITIAQTIVSIGFTVIVLKIASHKKAAYADSIPQWNIIWRYLAANIIAGLLTILGLILFIVPGIYLMLRFSMVRFAAVEGMGVRESLRKSRDMTHGVKWQILLFFIAIGFINLIGLLCFMVGLLVTIPVTAVAYAHVYQKLKSRHVEAV